MTRPNDILFERGAICVTPYTLSTRFKDEDLAPVQSVVIGRDPLWISGVIAAGLVLFANRFGDLLFWHEQLFLGAAGIALAVIDFCFASLQIGQHMRERTVLWAPIWTINAVRRAMAEARHIRGNQVAGVIFIGDDED